MMQTGELKTGELIDGKYRIDRPLGSGGMGAVYLARQVSVGNQVALKFLPAHLADDPQVRRRFEREAALTLAVTHPGAAQLLDAGQDEDGQLYLAFEYVEGDDLSGLLDREGALPFAEALEITLKVAEALAFAHQKGVVHRDIKPENIRVRRDLAGLHVKVLDFGIARVTDDAATRLTVEGGVAGTPRYMAPEQIGAGTIDARTDIYALGLVLFEMLTGREAFDRESTSQLMWAQLNDPVPALREVQPLRDTPQLDAVIARCCAKLSADRYASMREMVDALKALPPPQWDAPQPVKRRGRSSASNKNTDRDPNGSGARDEVLLSRPGRTTLTHRRVGMIGLGLGIGASALAGAAIWLVLGRAPTVPVPQPAARVPTQAAAQTAAQPAGQAAIQDATQASSLSPPSSPPPTSRPSAQPSGQPSAQPSGQPSAQQTPRPGDGVAPVGQPATHATARGGAPVIVGANGPVIINGVPVQPGTLGQQAALAPIAASGTSVGTTGGAADCPALAMYDPAFAALSIAELERRALALRYIAPSVAARQLETMKTSAENYAPAMRECMYKATLVQTVLNERTVLQSTPAMWGHTREVGELERLFMEQPLREDWSAAQRRSVLQQVETLFIANLKKDAPGDDAYWRRMYYGILFTCEASDEALASARARRQSEGSCLKLKPAI